MKTIIGMPNEFEHEPFDLPPATAKTTGMRRKRVFLGTPVYIPLTVSRRKLDHCRLNMKPPPMRQSTAQLIAFAVVCYAIAFGVAISVWL
jgi:hypothetical protein